MQRSGKCNLCFYQYSKCQLFNKPGFNLKYELCEVILCKVPDTLKDIGITVMDGEFFSIMPFGFSKYHTLTSVHYTPHTVSSPEPSFPCMKNGSCSPHNIGNCNLCLHKPLTAYEAMKTQYEEFIHPNYMVSNTSLPCLQLSPFRFHQKKQMKEIPLFKWQSNRHSIFLSSLVKYRHFMSLIAI